VSIDADSPCGVPVSRDHSTVRSSPGVTGNRPTEKATATRTTRAPPAVRKPSRWR